jgi:putative membrane protein
MMKRINYKKRAAIHGLSMAVFLGACLGLQANDNDHSVSGQATVNTGSSAASADHTSGRTYTSTADHNQNGKLSRGDAHFVKEASQGGLMEVRLGQTAKDHASSPDVKNYGEMLVKDHTKANEKLSQLASEKGVNLAKEVEPKHTDMIKDMEAKNGADFDRAFIEHAVKDHRKDIAEFEKASRDLNDSELKAFATETLPTLRNHLAEAERIAKSLGVNVEARNIDATAESAAAAGSPGLSTSQENSSVNRVDINSKDRAPGGRVDLDVDHNQPAGASANIDVNANQNSSGTSTSSSPSTAPRSSYESSGSSGANVDVNSSTEEPKKHKFLGLSTSKTDGKILGLFPAPGHKKAESSVNVDTDRSSPSASVSATTDHDASIGAPATSERGTSDANAGASANYHNDHSNTAKTLAYTDLPSKVQDTIQAQGGSSDNVKNVRKHTKDGRTVYTVKLNNKTLRISEDGTILKDTSK